jgi:hypothetical protein
MCYQERELVVALVGRHTPLKGEMARLGLENRDDNIVGDELRNTLAWRLKLFFPRMRDIE